MRHTRVRPQVAATLRARAHVMRQHMTPSEERLWHHALRGRKLGVPFRRQVPLLGKYIADFFAPVQRLVVEVDGGGYHARRVAADARRDAAVVRAGYRILRLDADLVHQDLPAAIARVRTALAG